MSKHRTTPQPATPQDSTGNTGMSRKKKIIIGGVATVGILATIGFLAPADDTDQADAAATTTTEETHTDRPVPETVTPVAEPDTTTTATPDATDPADGGLTVEVTGTGTAMVTYVGGMDFETVQDQSAALPWTHTDELSRSQALGANVSAMLDDAGEVSCRITHDGDVLAEEHATGQFAMVHCIVDEGWF